VTLAEVGGLGIADPAYVGRVWAAWVEMAAGGRSERGRQVGHDRAGGRRICTGAVRCHHLPTERLSTERLSTEWLSTECLSTEHLSTEHLSTGHLSTEYLATEYLATDYLPT